MLTGDKSRFAVEIAPSERVEQWVYGLFGLWIGGERLGDEEDATDLASCLRSIRDFLKNPRNRENDELFSLSTLSLIERMGNPRRAEPELWRRYHIDYIGMSAFDRYAEIILLIKNTDGRERVIWHSRRQPGREMLLHPGEIEDVFTEVVHIHEAMGA